MLDCSHHTPLPVMPFFIQAAAPWETNKGLTGQVGFTGETADAVIFGQPGSRGEVGTGDVIGMSGEPGVTGQYGLNNQIGEGVIGESGVVGEAGQIGSHNVSPGVVGEMGVNGEQGILVDGDSGQAGSEGLVGFDSVVGFTGTSGAINISQTSGSTATSVLGTLVYAAPYASVLLAAEIPSWDGSNLRPLQYNVGPAPLRTDFTVPTSQNVLIRVMFRIDVLGTSATPGTLLIGFHNSSSITNTPSYGYYAQSYNLGRDAFIFDFVLNGSTLPAAGTNVTLYMVGAATLPAGITRVVIGWSWYRTYGIGPPTSSMYITFPAATIVVIDLSDSLIII